VSSSSTPILTDERPPLGADGPTQRIRILTELSTAFLRSRFYVESYYDGILLREVYRYDLPQLRALLNMTL